jgi:hypothetical protein
MYLQSPHQIPRSARHSIVATAKAHPPPATVLRRRKWKLTQKRQRCLPWPGGYNKPGFAVCPSEPEGTVSPRTLRIPRRDVRRSGDAGGASSGGKHPFHLSCRPHMTQEILVNPTTSGLYIEQCNRKKQNPRFLLKYRHRAGRCPPDPASTWRPVKQEGSLDR